MRMVPAERCVTGCQPADEVTSRLFAPFYLKVLHGNVMSPGCADERDALLAQMRAVAPAVTFRGHADPWPKGWREA